MKRHYGKLKNTDQRCVVVMMQIPGRDDHALVVSTDNLPPRLEQALMGVAESAEGQGDAVLARVLHRRLYGDTGQNLMETLHNAGLLRAVHIDQVVMLPQPNMPFPLRKVIEGMGNVLPPADAATIAADEKYNPHTNNVQARSAEERANIARNLLIEANMLQSEADAKRQKAFEYAPELAPKKKSKLEVTALEETWLPKSEKAEKVVPVTKKTRTKKATTA